MNIQQIQYVLALAETRHFERAAERCFVTQSTLSTMISKFEDELGLLIFDRKKKPVAITHEGEQLIEQLKKIDREIHSLNEVAQEIKGEMKGNLSISVIPTIAPFLLPLFLSRFAFKFPELNIEVKEQTTSEILRLIKSRDLDIGIISIPIDDEEISEVHLYDEPFVYFDTKTIQANKIQSHDINLSTLCLLEEGHCMRTQILELCDSYEQQLHSMLNFRFLAGSIDSLLRFVRANQASTLLPYLASIDLSPEEKMKISEFEAPIPYRTVGLVVHKHFVKHKILDMLKMEIKGQVMPKLPKIEKHGKMLRPLEGK
jgi:LysR family transcriptional regulator, hydrogen peroxide-inducible genes activator